MRPSTVMTAALALLSGCALVPVLDGDRPVQSNNIVITITEIDRSAASYILRRELENGLYLPGLPGPLRLDITLSRTLDRLALERDGRVSRTVYFTRADYVLRTADGTELVRESAHALSGYDPVPHGFADVLAQADQHEQAAILLAQDIRTGLTAALSARK